MLHRLLLSRYFHTTKDGCCLVLDVFRIDLDVKKGGCATRVAAYFLGLMSSSVGGKSSSRTSYICIGITASTLAEFRQAELGWRRYRLNCGHILHATGKRGVIQMAGHAIFCNNTHVVNKKNYPNTCQSLPGRGVRGHRNIEKFS